MECSLIRDWSALMTNSSNFSYEIFNISNNKEDQRKYWPKCDYKATIRILDWITWWQWYIMIHTCSYILLQWYHLQKKWEITPIFLTRNSSKHRMSLFIFGIKYFLKHFYIFKDHDIVRFQMLLSLPLLLI